MAYRNPVPCIDMGKAFEFRLEMKFDELTRLEDAKLRAAEYVLAQDPAVLASWFHCLDIRPVYPKDLSEDERKALGIGSGDPA